MIGQITGESFRGVANVDNGRNGLASIGQTTINTSPDISNAIIATSNSIAETPIKIGQNLNYGFENLLGSQATETIYEYDDKGNVKSKKEVPIADSYNADGLLGKHYQREAVTTATEQKKILLNQQMQEVDKQGQAIANEFKVENDIVRAMKQSITDKADTELHNAFGNIGTFDDTKKVFENYFLKVANLDMTMAVDSWRKGKKNSQIYNELVGSKKMSENDFNRLMSYANKVVNIDVDKTNALNGELDFNNTKRLYESTRAILGQNGYNDVQSAYLADTGIKLGVTNIEQSKKGLELATFNNRLEKGKLQADAITIENNQAMIQKYLDRQAAAAERQASAAEKAANNVMLGGGNGELPQNESSELVIDDWEKGSYYNYGDDKIVITTSDGKKYVFNKGAYTLSNDGKKLIPIKEYNGDTNLIELKNGRLNMQDENKMIQDKKRELLKQIRVMENKNSRSIEYKEAIKKAQQIQGEIADYFGIDKDFNIHSEIANNDSGIANSIKHNVLGIGESIVGTFDDRVKYTNMYNNIDKLLETYRQNPFDAEASESKILSAVGMVAGGTGVGAMGIAKYLIDLPRDNAEHTQRIKDEKAIVSKEDMLEKFKQQQQTQQETQQQNAYNKANALIQKHNGNILKALDEANANRDSATYAALKTLTITPEGIGKEVTQSSKLISKVLTNGDEAAKMLKDNSFIYEEAGLDNFSYSKINDNNFEFSAALAYMLSKQNSKIAKSTEEMSRFITAVYGILNAKSDSEANKIHAQYVKKNASPLTTYLNINTPVSIRAIREKFNNKNMNFNQYLQQINQMNLIKG